MDVCHNPFGKRRIKSIDTSLHADEKGVRTPFSHESGVSEMESSMIHIP